MHVGVLPPRAGPPGRGIVSGQLMGYLQSHHPFVHVLAEYAPHDIGLRLVYHRPAVLPDPVSIGDRAIRHSALLGLPAPAHGCSLPDVVQFYLPDGRHDPEHLHVDGVHDRLQANLVRLDDLHQGSCRVHPAAQPVHLPAHDDVEPAVPSIG